MRLERMIPIKDPGQPETSPTAPEARGDASVMR